MDWYVQQIKHEKTDMASEILIIQFIVLVWFVLSFMYVLLRCNGSEKIYVMTPTHCLGKELLKTSEEYVWIW